MRITASNSLKTTKEFPIELPPSSLKVKESCHVSDSIGDIADCGQNKEIPNEKEQINKHILDSSMDGLLMVDLQGKLFEVNSTYCEMSGYNREELLSMNMSDIDVSETLENILVRMQEAIHREHYRFETKHRRKNGSIFDVEVSAQHINIKGGLNACFIRDITDFKNAAAALKISRDRLFFTTEGAYIGIWNWSIATGETIVSDKCKAIFGLKSGEVMSYETFLNRLHPDDREKTVNIVKDSLHHHKDFDTEFRILKTDESIQWIAAKGRGYYDQDGKIVRMDGITLDITERKKAEEELHSLRAKSDFISMVTHELRSPLGTMQLGLDFIFNSPIDNLNEKQLKILTTSRNSINRLVRLINNTLDLQKLSSGKVSLDIQKNNINNLVQEVRSSMLQWTNEKNIYLNVSLDDSLPLVPFDRDKIIQVLVNLLSNAIKFTDKGGITISTSSHKNEVVVSVKDEGIGIEEKDIAHLFMPFKQLGNAKNHKKGSSGLGLSISKNIIDAHDGKIWAKSKIGQGTVFSFSLPLKTDKS